MGSPNTEVKVAKKDLERAQNMWDSFVEISKWSTLGIVIILVLLGVLFL